MIFFCRETEEKNKIQPGTPCSLLWSVHHTLTFIAKHPLKPYKTLVDFWSLNVWFSQGVWLSLQRIITGKESRKNMSQGNPKHKYRMDWERDLGMFVDELSMAWQCLLVTQKANSTLGCTQGRWGRGFSPCTLFLWPYLECCVQLRNPHHKKDVDLLNLEEGCSEGLRLKEGRFRTGIRKTFFPMRVVKHWNRLPICGCPSLEVFRASLDEALSQVIKCLAPLLVVGSWTLRSYKSLLTHTILWFSELFGI